MTNSNYIKIFTGDFIMAQRIVADLEKIDIIPIIKDHTESARLAGFGGGIVPGFQQLFVHKDEIEKAVFIVKEILADNYN